MHRFTRHFQSCVQVHRASTYYAVSLQRIYVRSLSVTRSSRAQPMRCAIGLNVSFGGPERNLHACPSSRSHSGVSGRRASRGAGARAFGYSHAAIQQCPRRAWRTLRRRARRVLSALRPLALGILVKRLHLSRCEKSRAILVELVEDSISIGVRGASSPEEFPELRP
jgi:hypothetical protein